MLKISSATRNFHACNLLLLWISGWKSLRLDDLSHTTGMISDFSIYHHAQTACRVLLAAFPWVAENLYSGIKRLERETLP
jgi:hypothetical protein